MSEDNRPVYSRGNGQTSTTGVVRKLTPSSATFQQIAGFLMCLLRELELPLPAIKRY